MRQIILDTETTGLEPQQGHRVIEIGCVELINRRPTGQHFHSYLQPDREIDEGAAAVHGITSAFLQDKPRFADVADEFLAFIRGAELIIHNAPFDMGFLEAELALLGRNDPPLEALCHVVDSLVMARQMHPGQRNSLDALCKRYEINNEHRELHGALLDAQLLAEVYLAMTGGQTSFLPEVSGELISQTGPKERELSKRFPGERPSLRVIHANDNERLRHEEVLDELSRDQDCLWRRIEGSSARGFEDA